MSRKKALGNQGEQLAASYLKQKGYTILETNWRDGRSGEVDLIATRPDTDLILFIEVKTRIGTRFGAPLESVRPAKQAKLLLLAESYLHTHGPGTPIQVRFDVISILYYGADHPPEIVHLENAFDQS